MAKKTKTRYLRREQIGSGDYAKVYAAEDTKLGRKVAVKQLHSQFIEDHEKLNRYWQEAQLLVDLEHPNVMSIYDVLKSRGCLVLELMKGSLRQIYGKKPMPVEEVRETLLQVARGLECLHQNGIIHGDVKPSNLMLSRQGIVKLGDFGLARRVTDDDGSLLKGTTKYMAPELVSEEFGDVGPASDLYSLGFSALELMIGPDFDSLFPDLIAFGRDQQMAWMMWHCSADRRLPPMTSILQGVPADLAAVLQKLTAKQQSQRYSSATELISDLTGGVKPVGDSIREEELALAASARLHKRKRRIQAAVACCASLLLCWLIIWLSGETPPAPVAVAPPPIRGVVRNVLANDQKFVMEIGDDFEEISLRHNDLVQLNRRKRQLRDLQLGDRIVVRTVLDEGNKSHRELIAFRPETHQGTIADVQPETGQLLVAIKRDGAPEELDLIVTDQTEIVLNKSSTTNGQPNLISGLSKNDRVIVDISDDEQGILALRVDALRYVELKGVIRKLDPRNGSITVAHDAGGPEEQLVTLPIDPDCVFTLNDLTAVADRLLAANNIQVGDRVSIRHDIKIHAIDAYRAYEDKGRIIDIDYDQNELTVKSPRATAAKVYRIDDLSQLLLQGETVAIGDLRAGDDVQLVHESPEESSPVLVSLNAIRPLDKNKWAILIGNQSFSSPGVAPLTTSMADLKSIKQQLVGRFRVPESQVTVFENASRVRIESELPNIIGRLDSGDELYVYVATRGYNDKNRNAYLAGEDFVYEQMDSTGIGLDWLIRQLDASATKRKLLMLDCRPGPTGQHPTATAAEMVEIVKQNQRGGFPRSTFVLASCKAGDQDVIAKNSPDNGLFGLCLAKAFSGEADQERDTDVKITELTSYVTEQVDAMAKSQQATQNPVLFPPDDRPARISAQAEAAILQLLSRLGEKDLETESIIADASNAKRLATGEPEPRLAEGLLLIKSGEINLALEELEQLRLENPNALVVHQAVIWIHFYKKHYRKGNSKLFTMLQNIRMPEKKNETYSEDDLRRIEWAGRLRELAGSVDWTTRIPTAKELQRIDQYISDMGPEPIARFASGRKHVAEVILDFDQSLKDDSKSKAELERQRISFYVPPIASPETVEEIRRGLER